MLKRLLWFFTGRCPECGGALDSDAHGYDHKWSHCHDCGYCTHAKSFGKEQCSVR